MLPVKNVHTYANLNFSPKSTLESMNLNKSIKVKMIYRLQVDILIPGWSEN